MDKVILGTVLGPIGVGGQFKCRLFSYPPTWQTAFVSQKPNLTRNNLHQDTSTIDQDSHKIKKQVKSGFSDIRPEIVEEPYEIHIIKYPYNVTNNLCICSIDSMNTRSEINQIIGQEIWTDRQLLPDNTDEDEIYCHDMKNLSIYYEGGEIGKLVQMHDFGAGLILQTDKNLYIHWNNVDQVDLNSGIYIKNNSLDE